MNRPSFNRNLWMLNTIYQAGTEGLTFEEICQKWQSSGLSKGKNYPLRSFHNHRKEILDTFNIAIRCRKNTNRYYIKNNEAAAQLMMKVLGLIGINQTIGSDISARISYTPCTGGEGFLAPITSAIQNKKMLKVVFSNSSEKTTYAEVKPLGIKEYKNCWYLLGQLVSGQFVYVNLAYTNEITPLNETFAEPTDAPVQELLVENYGSRLEEIPTEEITLKVPAAIAQQIKQFPIHPSQRELENKKSHSIFYLNLKPTTDFILDLMTFGNQIEIITPASIKEKVADEARKIIKKNQ